MKFSRRNFLKAASQGIALTAVGIGSAKRVIAALPQAAPNVPLALPSPIAFETDPLPRELNLQGEVVAIVVADTDNQATLQRG
jgi:hypothetical protein